MRVFDESLWATPGSNIDYQNSGEVESEIISLRQHYPELERWGDLAIFSAWGSYSQDNYELAWAPVVQREDAFLEYLAYIESGADITQWPNMA